MPDPYHQLLDATIQYLDDLKARGARFVSVSPQLLAGLRQPAMPVRRNPLSSNRPGQPAAPQKGAAAAPAAGSGPSLSSRTEQPTVQPPPVEPISITPKPSLTPEAKAAAFAELRQRVMPCRKCAHLAAARKNVVFGVGDINAQLMFVGEAPGADEDAQGEPFVGQAGHLLTKIIQTMGLSRGSVYIANILKCRPDTPGQAAGNRKPTPEEMQTCIPYLQEQIDLIQPKVLVALGATAVEGLLGKTIGITRLRGQWRTYRGIPLMPTYHPAYLLRNQALS